MKVCYVRYKCEQKILYHAIGFVASETDDDIVLCGEIDHVGRGVRLFSKIQKKDIITRRDLEDIAKSTGEHEGEEYEES